MSTPHHIANDEVDIAATIEAAIPPSIHYSSQLLPTTILAMNQTAIRIKITVTHDVVMSNMNTPITSLINHHNSYVVHANAHVSAVDF